MGTKDPLSSSQTPTENISLGILAHVDAGKTTLSEQLLYQTNTLRTLGRVDHQNTALDTNAIERERGITVFADQATFTLDGRRFTLVDTPGHVDFAPEAERALWAMDMAVLVVDGTSGVGAHTQTLFALANRYQKPTLFFINKADLVGFDAQRTLSQIQALLTPATVTVENNTPDAEQLALVNDDFMQRYLNGQTTPNDAWQALRHSFLSREAFPVLTGAALSGQGVLELLHALSSLAWFSRDPSAPFDALVCKVRHDPSGERVTTLKIQSGTLLPRAAFTMGDSVEKVHQLRHYRGDVATPANKAVAGELIGVTGLHTPKPGDRLQGDKLIGEANRFVVTPALSAWVEPPDGVSKSTLLEKLRLLQAEEPSLSVGWDAPHSAVTVQVTGTVQIEVLTELLLRRFGMAVRFLPPTVLYMETISAPVVGCGHFEPLRHYAEVHLRLSPAPRGSGISFASRCHVDDLPQSYQSLVRTHIYEKTHRGVLIGAPLCDVSVELLSGRAHLKHTEGGDFREAVYRAIRQGLCKTQSVLLEPYYRFTLTVPAPCLGRAMSDMAALCGTCDPPETLGDMVRLCGRAPVACLMDYPTTLRAYTHGKGDIQLMMDGYDLCHNAQQVIDNAAYHPDADTDNPASSIFCSHGAGYAVPWNQADSMMHLPVEAP